MEAAAAEQEQSSLLNSCSVTVGINSMTEFSISNPFLALNYQSYFDKKVNSQFTKGCKWSPDGSCLLVANEDRELNIFNLPQNVADGMFHDEDWITEGWKKDTQPIVTINENEDIYDYCWYTQMNSDDPKSCCFATTCRELPIHLWNARTGQLICSYKTYDHLDQMISAYSVTINNDGQKIISGYNKSVRIFDVSRPGRLCENIKCEEQSGIISCLTFSPELPQIFAVGSYEGSVGLFSLNYKKPFLILKGHSKGVTHLQFSNDSTKLCSGTRNNDDILIWDVRNPGMILAALTRNVKTNQRIYFDFTPSDSKFLLSGSTNGEVLIWNLQDCLPTSGSDNPADIPPTSFFKAHSDCVNGISMNPFCPVLATSSGQRHYDDTTSEDSSVSNDDCPQIENNVKLWWLGQMR